MRRLLPPSILAAVVVLAVAPALAATRTVDITTAGFTPKNLTIDFGDTVTWANKDTANHQVLADGGAFPTSPVLSANQTYSYTFMKSGKFDYRDSFNTNRTGSITVRTGVSIAGAPPVVTYGRTTALSGVVSSLAAGENVTINAMECGKTTFAQAGSVRSVANGAWSFAAKPNLNTVYQARWRNNNSAQLATKVAPAVALRKVRRGRFTASVTAAQSFAGKYVVLQRYVRTSRKWRNVKRVTLRTVKAGTAPTMITSAGFRARVTRGTRLRLQFPQAQAGTCYVQALSSAVRA